MTTKVVIRLLTSANELLGWTEIQAVARGDGTLRTAGPVVISVEQTGTVELVSLHWADVNVETRVPFLMAVHIGQLVPVFPADTSILVVGPMPGPLPAVTMRTPVAVAVPVGALGAFTSA